MPQHVLEHLVASVLLPQAVEYDDCDRAGTEFKDNLVKDVSSTIKSSTVVIRSSSVLYMRSKHRTGPSFEPVCETLIRQHPCFPLVQRLDVE